MIVFDKPPDILVVDDNLENLKLLIALLDEKDYLARPVNSGALALRAIEASLPDLILLDINMAEISGYEVCEILKEDPKTHDIPIIFLSAYQDVGEKLRAFQAGGIDYISKPFSAEEVFARIENHLAIAALQKKLKEQNLQLRTEIRERKKAETELRKLAQAINCSGGSIVITDLDGNIEFVNAAFSEETGYTADEILGQTPSILKSGKTERHVYDQLWNTIQQGKVWRGELLNRRKNGELYWDRLIIAPITNTHEQITHYVAVRDDISKLKEKEQHLAYSATHDILTGLPNRAFFKESMLHALALAERNDWQAAVLFIDFDNFKLINDRFGHLVGDEILLKFGKRLKKSVRESDTVARFGGDEFCCLLEKIPNEEYLPVFVKKFLENLKEPFKIGTEDSIYLTASIGISVFSKDGNDYATLLKNADQAMYEAKKGKGEKNYSFYSDLLANHVPTEDE